MKRRTSLGPSFVIPSQWRGRGALLWLKGVILALLTSAAAAQSPTNPVRIGLLCPGECTGSVYTALEDELRKLGWIEGSTITIDRRAAETLSDRLPALAADLVRTKPHLIVAAGPQPARAAKQATLDIPIVIMFVADPVGIGLARSLAHPGGNLTGVTTLGPGVLVSKQLEVIRELLPGAERIVALVNPSNEVHRLIFPAEAPAAAAKLGLQIDVINVSESGEIAGAIAKAKSLGASALMVMGNLLFHTPPNRVPDLAREAGLPAIFLPGYVAKAGGLMSYGSDFDAIARRGAHYVDRILKGAAPDQLPIEQPTKYQIVINLKTARALGLSIPESLLARADEVIE